MYGYRARIGYCSPPYVTEVFCSEFYQMAPPGVTLMLTTLAITSLTSAATKEQMAASHAKSLEAAKAMARAGANVVVLGGNPINQSRGVENLDEICSSLSREIGAKVVTSTHAQMHALRALGARKVATVQPFAPEMNARSETSMRNLGVEPAGTIACGYTVEDLGRIPGDLAVTLARQVKREHPEADTIHHSCAHWATAHAIERIEQELDVDVMTSQQAIFWKALRTAGIADKIEGYGRLLREF
jgi:maleate isomerase